MRRTILCIAALVVLAPAAGCAERFGVASDAPDSSTAAASTTTTTTPQGFEAAGEIGPDPFLAAATVPLPLGLPTGESVTTAPASLPAGVLFFPPGAGTIGLYGGTGTNACDTTQLVAFLQTDVAAGAAWAQVLGITPDGIAGYVATLVPGWLVADTRVTNHGYAGGVATPRQATLEAGTAVLVDAARVPRVRCRCGNPLLPAVPSTGSGSGTTTTTTSASVTGQAATTDQMLGHWYSDEWGDTVFVTDGANIGGVYTHQNGTILGQMGADGVFRGWWTEEPTRAGPNDAGEVEFVLKQTPTGTMLDGRWRYDTTGDWREDWDIEFRGSTDGAPPELVARANTETLPGHP